MKKIVLGLCILSLVSFNNVATAKKKHNKPHSYHQHYRHKLKLNKQLKRIIRSNDLTGDPMLNRMVPDIDSPKAQLGMDLFFSKTLGGEFDSACVACHHPVLGGGDNLSLPIGVEADEPDLLGPGRTKL